MTSFLLLSALMVAGAGLFFVPTLWRAQPAGLAPSTQPERWTAVWLLTGVVIASAVVYLAVGSPQALLAPQDAAPASSPATSVGAAPTRAAPEAEAQQPSMTAAQIEGMVARLAQRLQNQPDDPAGWRMLARSYETLGRFPQAVEAYKKLLALTKPDADLLTDYAVALGMALDRSLKGEPEALINQALKLDPRHIQALALSGSAAFEQKDYARAIAQWNKILAVVPPDAEMRASIERNIEQADTLAKQQGRPTGRP